MLEIEDRPAEMSQQVMQQMMMQLLVMARP
ncbi:hypothetical protein ISM_04590 [Roseovarius nubinhibens ISM]|uniref:Uncharacterized protein n=1 Tax=Roseovarius nubinhibens (strain ATCC BAA-591 / DSM 15170 / ISM) TaxID=89187 RepID=A3SJL0_ROSNI|nr:hypothetical protein ISM_04590 [Roseovarius nubinhibens ISM]